jgi:hypothetical protein
MSSTSSRDSIIKRIQLAIRLMNVEDRKNKVRGLEAIKSKAMDMAMSGKDSLEIRDFVGGATKELAYEVPDDEAFVKAVKASRKFKESKEK